MRINSKLGTQHATFAGADAGEGLAIFLSQNSDATARYRFQVKAILDQGVYQAGVFYSSPPGVTSTPGPQTRMVAVAICPGARSWAVDITAEVLPGAATPKETAEVILTSSRCFSSPVGVSRVSERYAYHANTGATAVDLKPGQTVTKISATGLGGGGTIMISGSAETILVPANTTVVLEPKAAIPYGLSAIAFTGCDWAVEYLESA